MHEVFHVLQAGHVLQPGLDLQPGLVLLGEAEAVTEATARLAAIGQYLKAVNSPRLFAFT